MTAPSRGQQQAAAAHAARRDATGRPVAALGRALRSAAAPAPANSATPIATAPGSASALRGLHRSLASLARRAGLPDVLGAASARVPRGRSSRRLVGVNLVLVAGVALVSAIAAAPSFAAHAPASTERPAALDAASATPRPPAAAAAAPLTSPAPGASPVPAASPFAVPSAADGGLDLFDLGTKTAVVAGLLYLTLRVLRRMQNGGRGNAGDGIAVVETRSIAPKASVHIVSVRGRELVVGLSPAGLVTLADLGESRPTPVPAVTVSRRGVDLPTRLPARPRSRPA